MQIDIPSHIEKLLFLHEALVIPGFGGFTATRTPATADYVGGTVSSPSKTLSFSENLTIDDGILVNDITMTHGISTEDAQRVVAEFVEKMQSLLSQREIVTLPGVGRLYKNYIQKIQFLPDATNFNAASYGLPPLQFSPIARSREVSPDQAAAIKNDALTPPPPNVPVEPPVMPEATYAPQRSNTSSVGTALGIVFLLASLSAGIWYWQHKKKQERLAANPGTEQVDTNTPSEEASQPVSDSSTPDVAASTSDQTVQEAIKQRMEEASKTVKGRQCVLIIATLSQQENADKLRALLKEEDFVEYYYHHKTGHQVGVQFYYTHPAEIQDNINRLESLTGEKNIIIRKK